MAMWTASAGKDSMESFDLHFVSLPLKYVKNPKNTRMYEGLSKKKAMALRNKNYTYNSHRFGFSPKTFKTDDGLNKFWDVTAHHFMPNGTAFVASIEAKNYPFFGTQGHPEKPSQVWYEGLNIDHSWESIQVQAHFSKLFVKMARANQNSIGNYSDT